MDHLTENPLLNPGRRIAFDRIEARHAEPAIRELIDRGEARLRAIADVEGVRTFDNTMRALDEMTPDLDTAFSVVRHLKDTASTPPWREAFKAVEPAAVGFYSRIPLEEGLWRALNEFAATDEAKGLTGTRRRYLDKTIAAFRRHGAGLDAERKAELERLDIELSSVTTQFAENVLDATNAFEHVITDEDLLAGLPASAVVMARENAEQRGLRGWRFTLQQPSYLAIMTYSADARLREIFYRAYNERGCRAPFDNRHLLTKILKLRREKAALLGYPNFPDFALEDRMAGSGDRAQTFLDDLHRKTIPFFERENTDLLAFRREIEGQDAPALEPWDVSYYAEKLRKARYDFDEEMLRPYFPLERVVAGLFELVSRLFGIRVVEVEGVPTWDPQVRTYTILDGSGRELALFYADWYPRDNKRGGAWMDAFVTGRAGGAGGGEPHVGLMCGNLTPPSGGKPALLTHRDVETIFHEFGHLLHHCLSKVEVRSLAGTNVPWDFVELPSQIMENWAWEREALNLFAAHYETGEAIPQALFERLKRTRTFRAANAMMRQLSFGILDLKLHRDYDEKRDGDVLTYSRNIANQFSPATLQEDYGMIAAFTHLFASPMGYAAGYYSYKWAEVLDADAYSVFQKEGIFSQETGARFRARILERGDSEDPAELYRSFAGRDPDPAALLIRAGLVTAG